MEQHHWKERIQHFLWSFRDNKKAQIVLMSFVVVLLCIGLSITIWLANKKPATVNTNAETLNININTTSGAQGKVARIIDGVKVELGKENIFPTCVMIENLASVRPQSGLQAANIVYEALAEGGITRFMAVYADDENSTKIGPVRSARPYFVDWAEEYRCLYTHAGASPQAMDQLAQNTFVTDLNALGGTAAANFWRDSSVAVREHSLFTSSELLMYASRDRGILEKNGTFSSWSFDAPVKKQNRAATQSITLPFSSSSYGVHYTYDSEHNWYLRSNGDESHIDAATGEQLYVTNIVVQLVSTSLLEASSGRLQMETTGTGKAYLFHDGTVQTGEWKKDSTGSRTQFMGSNGQPMQFIPGNIWVEILPDDRTIDYTQ